MICKLLFSPLYIGMNDQFGIAWFFIDNIQLSDQFIAIIQADISSETVGFPIDLYTVRQYCLLIMFIDPLNSLTHSNRITRYTICPVMGI